MELELYIKALRNISTNMDNEVEKAVKKNSKQIIGMLKARLFNQGTDGMGDSLEPYALSTIVVKKKNSQKTNITTLRDQGNFYAGMYLEANGTEILISSTDKKTNKIVEQYGEGIFDLTREQTEYVVSEFVDKAIQAKLDSLGDIDIEL